jgi:hypothetical protein
VFDERLLQGRKGCRVIATPSMVVMCMPSTPARHEERVTVCRHITVQAPHSPAAQPLLCR